MTTTATDNTDDKITCSGKSVSIEVEPKSVVHTSPEIFDEVENKFINRYPSASEVTDIIAIAASPFISVVSPMQRTAIAAAIVTTSIKGILFVH